MSLKEFAQTRARMQRLSDARFFAGWVHSASNGEIIVEMNATDGLAPGQVFLVQAFGQEACAMFEATARLIADKRVVLRIGGSIRFLEPGEEARLRVKGVSAEVSIDDMAVEAVLADMSQNGVGIATSDPLPKGQRVSIQFETPLGKIESNGEVRYCSQSGLDDGFRVGVRLDKMDRLNRARWIRLLSDKAA